MKLKSTIITGGIALFALASCKKNNVEVTKAEPDNTKTKTISSTMAPYDYSQSVEQIYRDATGREADPNGKVFILPGIFVRDDGDGIVCRMTSGICSICFTEKRKHRLTSGGGNNSISGGTDQYPIEFIKAKTFWPEYVPVQEINYKDAESEENYSVTVSPIEG